ncbi:hypothetical protein RDABS01_025203 [Bienertia sinuspersici]
MESSCNKNPKYEEKGFESFPESILVSILSLLPLKAAVTTSVLQTSLRSESRGNSGDIIFFFVVPPCIFQCETLVNLVLKISKRCFFPILTIVNLPKLKLLRSSHGGRYDNITMLIKSCPLLEVFDMSLNCPLDSPRISIIAPNLKSLSFKMRNAIHQHQAIIDTPK